MAVGDEDEADHLTTITAKRLFASAILPVMANSQWVYTFGNGKADGRAELRNLLGGKGAGLAEMSNLGLPVPPGFTITTEVCAYYYANENSYPNDLKAHVETALKQIEQTTGCKFGDAKNPLLVSV